eukprot:521554_1
MKSNILRIGLFLFMLAGQFIVDVSGADTEWNSAANCGETVKLDADPTTSQGVLYFTNNEDDALKVRIVPTVTEPSTVKSVQFLDMQYADDPPADVPISGGKYAMDMDYSD